MATTIPDLPLGRLGAAAHSRSPWPRLSTKVRTAGGKTAASTSGARLFVAAPQPTIALE